MKEVIEHGLYSGNSKGDLENIAVKLLDMIAAEKTAKAVEVFQEDDKINAQSERETQAFSISTQHGKLGGCTYARSELISKQRRT